MRMLAEVPWEYTLFEDEGDGSFYLRTMCNQSAYYFFYPFRLLPSELEGLFLEGTRTLSAKGKARLHQLSRDAQWSPTKLRDARLLAWTALGHEAEPLVPELVDPPLEGKAPK